MQLNFPTNPVQGQLYTVGIKTWLWNGYSWDLTSAGGGGVATFQTSLAGLTPSAANTGIVTLSGVLGTANGGTGATSYTANTLSYYNGSSFVSLSNVSTVGTYGNATTIPSITIDGYGRVTAVSNASVYIPSGFPVISTNESTISSTYTLTSANNGFSVGPVTISPGYGVSMAVGTRWVII